MDDPKEKDSPDSKQDEKESEDRNDTHSPPSKEDSGFGQESGGLGG